MGSLSIKPGVQFTVIAPAGFAILAALKRCARQQGLDLVITSACDGAHSGPADPHHRGEAYDVRCHTLSLAQRMTVLETVLADLGTAHFFGFREDPGTPNEHLHFQVRRGTTLRIEEWMTL